MKSSIVGAVVAVLIVVVFLIIGSIQINDNIADEVNTTVNNAIYSAQRTLYDQREEISSNEQYIAVFNKDLKEQLPSDDDVEYSIAIMGVDYEKGLLDVEVTAKYDNLLGQDKEEKVRRTMIIEKIKTDE